MIYRLIIVFRRIWVASKNRSRRLIKFLKRKMLIPGIILRQGTHLRKEYSPDTEQLIIFLTTGLDLVNGGILSIASIYEETNKLYKFHGSKAIMCTTPGDELLFKYTKFNNQFMIFRFPQILSYFKNIQKLMIHIPEFYIGMFLNNIRPKDLSVVSHVKELSINILLQNIDRLPSKEHIEKLKKFGRTTCTTAHEQYSTFETRESLGVPLHKLSVYVSPEQYVKKKHNEKDDLMIVSPDDHPAKQRILELLMKQFPHLRIQVINGLTYEEYKELISRAKWSLTFGEGLDGYFVEPVFSGAVSFSVYNSDFFTDDFSSLKTVYDDYDLLGNRICPDIDELDDEKLFTEYQNRQFNLCHRYYDYRIYKRNIKSFYAGDYTFA